MPYASPDKQRAYWKSYWAKPANAKRKRAAAYRTYQKRLVNTTKPQQVTHDRRAWLKYLYNITPEDFQRMYDAQAGRCALCHTVPPTPKGRRYNLYVDHDHITGTVRALLCHRCNHGLAFFEAAEFAVAAQTYLREHAA